MTAKEKADELVYKFRDYAIDTWCDGNNAKQCALIAVDEIINVIRPIMLTGEKIEYWREVKREIENL